MLNIHSFALDIKTQNVPRIRMVNGDTANQFYIHVTNDGNDVSFDLNRHKIIAVFTRADGQIYTQDGDTGVSFDEYGNVIIDVHPASFRTGANKVCLQIYKRVNTSDTEYPLLCTTQEAKFTARNAAIPDGGAPNAPSQLPMLEQLIVDAGEAVENANDAADAANDAADAANEAAETLNGMLANIDDEPTQGSDHLVKSGGVYSFVADQVQEAADDVRAQIPDGATSATADKPKMDGTASSGTSDKWARSDHVHPSDTNKQDVLTFDNAPTYNSNNPVKSGGVYAAIAGKQNLLVWDTEPTAGSNKPVTSDGIKNAIDAATVENRFVGDMSNNCAVERVADGTKVLNKFAFESACALVGHAFNAQGLMVYGFSSYQHDFGHVEIYTLFGENVTETELSYETAAFKTKLNIDESLSFHSIYTGFVLNASRPHRNIRLCLMVYDATANVIETIYTEQYHAAYNNGSPTFTRFETSQQPRRYVTEVGLKANTSKAQVKYGGSFGNIELEPLVSTAQNSQYDFIVPDSMFTDAPNGYSLAYRDGHGNVHTGANVFQAAQ